MAIIDKDETSFRRLASGLSARRVTGVGFDRETLEAAGIQDAYAFAAVSSGDNSNIIAARVARETYGIEHVVARIYDPGRAEIYQRLGIPTVATVRWASDQILRRMLPQGQVPEFTDPSGRIVVAEVPAHIDWVGQRLSTIETVTSSRVAYLTRLGEGMLPGPDAVYQMGDLLHLAVRHDELSAVERLLDSPPPQGGES